MKARIILAVILSCLPLLLVQAQERIDVVYLKNGDILKGTIIENTPKKRVRIELQGGSVFTVKYSDILKLTKESATPEKVNPEKTAPEKVALPQGPTAQPKEVIKTPGQLDTPQMLAFEKGKKSKGAAVALSILVTSTGHAYVGNWGRGLIFSAGRIGGAVLALTAGFETKYGYYSSYDPYADTWLYEYPSSTETTPFFYIGIGVSVACAIWEAIDVAGQVDKYNENLYNSLNRPMPLSINIVPTLNGPNVQLKYNF
jgi:hypothetical protein